MAENSPARECREGDVNSLVEVPKGRPERGAAPKGQPWLKILSLIIFGSLCLTGCSRSDRSQPPAPLSSAAITNAASPKAQGFAEVLPRVGGPEGYAGSSSCRKCHEDQYTSWHRSF